MGGISLLDFPVTPHTGDVSETLIVAGSQTGVSGESWGLTATLVLDGVSVGSVAYTQGYSLTTSSANQFTAAVVFPPATTTMNFTIACTGGNPSSDSGIVLHVWQN